MAGLFVVASPHTRNPRCQFDRTAGQENTQSGQEWTHFSALPRSVVLAAPQARLHTRGQHVRTPRLFGATAPGRGAAIPRGGADTQRADVPEPWGALAIPLISTV